jgi:membrane-associated phospholipid phosphatase
MRDFFGTLPRHIVACFAGRRVVWHLLFILLTLLLVQSGLDWQYYRATRGQSLHDWMIPAALIGGLVPLLLPLLFLLIGHAYRQPRIIRNGWLIAQAEIMGSLISSAYKAFTGRAHPLFQGDTDLTHLFHFGFLRGGTFWGWPSSHTTIAFATAGAVCAAYPGRRWLNVVAWGYALYIGVGVSLTIHWLSDFVAGAILGTLIGRVVGTQFPDAKPL